MGEFKGPAAGHLGRDTIMEGNRINSFENVKTRIEDRGTNTWEDVK